MQQKTQTVALRTSLVEESRLAASQQSSYVLKEESESEKGKSVSQNRVWHEPKYSNVFIGISSDVQQCFCSLMVHKEAKRVSGVGVAFPITHSQLGHKVAATLVLVRGSICLILQTEGKWECSFNLRNKTPDLAWVMFTWLETGTHPTCCPPTPDMLRVGCCSLLHHWQRGCTRTLRCPERQQSNTCLLQLTHFPWRTGLWVVTFWGHTAAPTSGNTVAPPAATSLIYNRDRETEN